MALLLSRGQRCLHFAVRYAIVALLAVTDMTSPVESAPLPTEGECEMRVAVGRTFEVVLDENPTTGYLWSSAEVDSKKLEPVGSKFVRGGTAPGAGGNRIFEFKATGVGVAEIEFKLTRSCEVDAQPMRTRKVSVCIAAAAS